MRKCNPSDLAAEIESMRECYNDAIDGIECTLVHQGEGIEAVQGLANENAVVIRSVMRRLDRRMERIEKRLHKLDGR